MLAQHIECYPIRIEPGTINHYSQTLHFPNTAVALEALARTVATNSIWKEIPYGSWVVRGVPQPVLVLLGRFDKMDARRVSALARRLSSIVARLRYVDYAQAEQDCAQLAAHLIARFGHEEMRRFCYTAIPRGGFIVLGMLAYILGLNQEQLEPPYPPDVPLVIVDDCALTGARFSDALEHCKSDQVIFAHLYSHPELRAAILAKEPRVTACLSAHNLHDYSDASPRDAYDDWKERWLAASGRPRYWVGKTEHLCFAWGEPDHVIYSKDGEDLGNWQIVPPELCLKNRPAPDMNPISIQIQPESCGPLKPAGRVVYGEVEQQIVIGDLETGETFGLADVSADMWRSIVTHGQLEPVVVELLSSYDVDETTLRVDVQNFINALLDRGLLASDADV